MDATFVQLASVILAQAGIMTTAVVAMSWYSTRQINLLRTDFKDELKTVHDNLVLLIKANSEAITRNSEAITRNSEAVTRIANTVDNIYKEIVHEARQISHI